MSRTPYRDVHSSCTKDSSFKSGDDRRLDSWVILRLRRCRLRSESRSEEEIGVSWLPVVGSWDDTVIPKRRTSRKSGVVVIPTGVS